MPSQAMQDVIDTLRRPASRPGTSSGSGSVNQTAQVNDMRTIAGSKRQQVHGLTRQIHDFLTAGTP